MSVLPSDQVNPCTSRSRSYLREDGVDAEVILLRMTKYYFASEPYPLNSCKDVKIISSLLEDRFWPFFNGGLSIYTYIYICVKPIIHIIYISSRLLIKIFIQFSGTVLSLFKFFLHLAITITIAATK